MHFRIGLTGLILALLASCTAQNRENRREMWNACPEYRNLRCVSNVVCRPTNRGCDSCECAALIPDSRAGYGDKR
jgi:hypothetical protein